MPGELISTEAAAIGAGAWLGKELFAPTLKRAGEGVAVFLTDRVKRVFSGAASKLKPGEQIDLDPGFLALFCQRASFASADDELSGYWANLLLDANRAFSNKHANYVDILSQIGPVEASILNAIVADFTGRATRPKNLQTWVQHSLNRATDIYSDRSRTQAAGLAAQLLDLDLGWPRYVRNVEVPWTGPDGKRDYAQQGITRLTWSDLAFDILQRQQLLEAVDFESDQLTPIRIHMLLVTALGLDFVRVCRGDKEDQTLV